MSNTIQKHSKRKAQLTIKFGFSKQFFIYYIIICIGFCTASCIENKQTNSLQYNTKAWNKIKDYFNPPVIYKDNYGNYRSPLLLNNGDTIKNVNDWNKKRKKIKDTWMNLMGKWPPIIKNQKFEILDTLKRENFYQYRVRFYWVPNEQTEGYLLIPDKRGKKPAIISVFYEPETAIGIGGKPNRDFAYQLTKRGFITLSLGTTQTTKEKTYSIYYPTLR